MNRSYSLAKDHHRLRNAPSRATSLAEFQLAFGLLVGAATGAFYAPMMALASGWIEKNRSLAVALVSAGAGTAPLTVAPFARWLAMELSERRAYAPARRLAELLLLMTPADVGDCLLYADRAPDRRDYPVNASCGKRMDR